LLKSENGSRSLNNLPQVSRERSKATLLVRFSASGRPRALAQARTNPSSTHWILHSWKKMGATESKHSRSYHAVGCAGSRFRRGSLEPCVRRAGAEERCSASL